MSGLPSLPQNIPLIHTESRQIGWRDFFRTHSRRLAPDSKFNERSIFFDSSIASLQAARDGLGIALESNILAQRDLASGMLVQPLTQTGITGETYYFIAHESKNFENTIVYAFYRWLSDSAKAPTLQRQPRPEQ